MPPLLPSQPQLATRFRGAVELGPITGIAFVLFKQFVAHQPSKSGRNCDRGDVGQTGAYRFPDGASRNALARRNLNAVVGRCEDDLVEFIEHVAPPSAGTV